MMSRSEQGLERLGRRVPGWLPVLECAGSASFARWQADRLINWDDWKDCEPLLVTGSICIG